MLHTLASEAHAVNTSIRPAVKSCVQLIVQPRGPGRLVVDPCAYHLPNYSKDSSSRRSSKRVMGSVAIHRLGQQDLGSAVQDIRDEYPPLEIAITCKPIIIKPSSEPLQHNKRTIISSVSGHHHEDLHGVPLPHGSCHCIASCPPACRCTPYHNERECIKNYDQHFQQEEKAVEARDMSPRNAENNKVSCASYSRRFPLPLSLPLSLSNANLSIRIYSLTVTTIGVVTNG